MIVTVERALHQGPHAASRLKAWRQRLHRRAHAAMSSPAARTIVGCRRRSWRAHGHDDAQLVRALDGAAQRLNQRLVDGVHAVQRHELVRAARDLHRQLQRDAVGVHVPQARQLLLDVLQQEADRYIAGSGQWGRAFCACLLHPQDARLGDDMRGGRRGLVGVDAVGATCAHTITNAQDGRRRVLAGLQTSDGARGWREIKVRAASTQTHHVPKRTERPAGSVTTAAEGGCK